MFELCPPNPYGDLKIQNLTAVLIDCTLNLLLDTRAQESVYKGFVIWKITNRNLKCLYKILMGVLEKDSYFLRYREWLAFREIFLDLLMYTQIEVSLWNTVTERLAFTVLFQWVCWPSNQIMHNRVI